MSEKCLKLRDEYGEYFLNTGTSKKPKQEDYNYDVCGAKLKHSMQRYGEARYCEAMAQSNFSNVGVEESEYCRNHKGYENVDELHKENFKTGAYVESYKSLAEHMPVHKYVVAVELYENLREDSLIDFGEPTYESHELDVSEVEWIDEDSVAIQFPIGEHKRTQEKALWFAALDFCRMEAMEEQLFEDAMKDDVGVGERTAVITVTDEGRKIEDEEEHHLNLPLSRVTKDYKRHLEFGGVPIEGYEDEEDGLANREWHLDVGPNTSVSMSNTTEEGGTEVPTFNTPAE